MKVPKNIVFAGLVATLVLASLSAHAGEAQYRFERLWPVLQQPWYFSAGSVAIDDDGFIYVTDGLAKRIQKYTQQGQYITQWGSEGDRPGQFDRPRGLAIDSKGSVFVVDGNRNRILKFTSNGDFLTEFGSTGSGPGQLDLPRTLAIDALDNIYVVEELNSRVSRFVPPQGDNPQDPHVFDFSFGGPGIGPGEFTGVISIVVDEIGDIFVSSARPGPDRVQKFRSDGSFVFEFGTSGTGQGEFRVPQGLAINQFDELLVGDIPNRIQVFDLAGNFKRELGPILPDALVELNVGEIDILPSGELILIGRNTGQLVKTTGEGVRLAEFGSTGELPGQFFSPNVVQSHPSGRIVVGHGLIPAGTRLQFFDPDGQYQFEYSIDKLATRFVFREDGRMYLNGFSGPQIGIYDPPAPGNIADPPVLIAELNNFADFASGIVIGNTGADQLLLPTVDFSQLQSPLNLDASTATTWAIETGDFNQDTQTDFVLGRNGVNGVLLGDYPAGVNATVPLSPEVANTRAVAVLDADGNGTTDIVTGNSDGPNRLFLNNGAGTFTFGSEFGGENDDTRALAAADINGDEAPDLFMGNLGSQSRIYLNNGAGSFTPGQTIGDAADSMVAAKFFDADRNGTYDLVVARNGTNQVYLNDDGTFGSPIDLSVDNHDTRALAIADINQDGFPDVIAGNFNQINRYYLNDGGGTMWAGVDIGDEVESTTSLAAYFVRFSGSTIRPNLVVGNDGQPNRGYYANRLFNQLEPLSLNVQLPDDGNLNTQALTYVHNLFGNVEGALLSAFELDISSGNQLYVLSDPLRKFVRFDGDGNILADTLIKPGIGQAAVTLNDMAVGADERVYVTDGYNNRVYRFAPPADLSNNSPHDLEFQFGESGIEDGQLDGPSAIDVLSNGNIVVADRQARLQLFTPDGQFVSVVSRFGSTPGAIASARDIDELPDGRLVAVDQFLDRVQTFRPQIVNDNAKAVLVAGGGPYPSNSLWNATQNNANFAYRVLVGQGFTKDTIFYLSDDTDLDLDGNGLADDVDGASSVANLTAAFTDFAADAENLVVYLVDHGGLDTFRMSGTELLTADTLATLLNDWQSSDPGRRMAVVYDACQSGSFLDELRSVQYDRIVITSSGPTENAYFVSQGSLSFSNQFWTHIFNGLSLEDAFLLASQSQTAAFPEQVPLVDADGDSLANTSFDLARLTGQFIGNGTQIFGEAPTVGSVTVSPPSGSSATVDVSDVNDADGIARVWMILRPPGFNPGSPDNPVQDLPTVEFSRIAGTNDYAAKFNNFVNEGTYQITVYAQDAVGNTAVPKVAFLTINDPARRKAIIVAGGDSNDSEASAINVNATLAYNALLQQGYGPDGANCNQTLCDDIQYLSNTGIIGLDAASTLTNLEFAITDWAIRDGQDLVVYLVGATDAEGFRLNGNETLSAPVLKDWLDTAQQALPGAIVVVLDAEQSGNFIPAIAPPPGESRINIASDGDPLRCNYVLDEEISFSRFFWGQVLNGGTVRQAFNVARQGIRFSSRAQRPLLDDNGDGVANEIDDGQLARNYSIGSGVLLAGDEPLVSSVVAPDSISGVSAVEVVASGVTSTGTILAVDAIVTLPTCEEVRLPMEDDGNGRYRVTTQVFSDVTGIHDIAVIARDEEGLSSLPTTAQVNQLSGSLLFSDGFEGSNQ